MLYVLLPYFEELYIIQEQIKFMKIYVIVYQELDPLDTLFIPNKSVN